MRIAELSARTGVPVPTIKYYIREGLVPRGERTHANQASYGDIHVRRIKLVRALVEIGGLSIATAAGVLNLLDQPTVNLDELLGRAVSSIGQPPVDRDDENWQTAVKRVEQLAADRGWRVDEDGLGTQRVTEVIAVMLDVGHRELLDLIDDYAEAAEQIAQKDLALVGGLREPQAILESAVVGTVLGEALLGGLRRMAHADASAKAFSERQEG